MIDKLTKTFSAIQEKHKKKHNKTLDPITLKDIQPELANVGREMDVQKWKITEKQSCYGPQRSLHRLTAAEWMLNMR